MPHTQMQTHTPPPSTYTNTHMPPTPTHTHNPETPYPDANTYPHPHPHTPTCPHLPYIPTTQRPKFCTQPSNQTAMLVSKSTDPCGIADEEDGLLATHTKVWDVAVHVAGNRGVWQGGVSRFVHWLVTRCLPKNIAETIMTQAWELSISLQKTREKKQEKKKKYIAKTTLATAKMRKSCGEQRLFFVLFF